jgi:hypothetical protein
MKKKNQFLLIFKKKINKNTTIDFNTQENRPNIKIYILCHNQSALEYAIAKYSHFYWAVPILMKYQDASFENAFWKQLLEIKDEWINCEMVGTLSSKFDIKINPDLINQIIYHRKYNTIFHYFMTGISNVEKSKSVLIHPNFIKIWSEIIKNLNLKDCIEVFCNYWICKPECMENFLDWFLNKAYSLVLSHPLIMTDSNYQYSSLDKEQLMNLCGVPYYPHLPFILERLNPCFLINTFIFN